MMKYFRKILIGLLVCALFTSILIIFISKKSKDNIITDIPTSTDTSITKFDTENQKGDLVFGNQTNIGFSQFDTKFLEFIGKNKGGESFMVSPISFKVALAMLTIGSNGDTQKKLLDVIGYKTSDDYLTRAINLKNLADAKNENMHEFDARQEIYKNGDIWGNNSNNKLKETGAKENNFIIANSVRHNSDREGKFIEQYKQNILKMGGIFGEIPGNELQTQINERVNKYTNGLIPSLIAQPIPYVNTVLVNTTYLKSFWTTAFEKYNTKQGDFTTIDGNIVKKDLMHNSEDYMYYEDKNSQVLTLYLQGGFAASFVLGDSSDILQKIKNSTKQKVKVTLPKFELETSLDKQELITFLVDEGLGQIFDPELGGDFSNMIEDVSLYVDDIIQKTKIKLHEDGLEAAAATAIMMKEAMAIIKETKPKEFIADKPFQFYIYTTETEDFEPQLLFYGQYVK